MNLEAITDLLNALEEESHRHYIPLIDREDGAALATLAYTSPNGVILDLGAGVGYSTLWLAVGASNKNTRIIAVEWDPDLAPRLELNARRIKEATGVDVEVVNMDAIEYLENNKEIIKQVSMAFVDIEKWQYQKALRILASNMKMGYIAFHNALFPKPPREFFQEASKYEHVIIPTHQGLMIIKI